jgi:hypothetical protein
LYLPILTAADDGQIRRTLEVMIKVRDGEILHMYREQLRVDGRFTDFHN